MANKSIIYQILDLLERRVACGSSTRITWVKAHTGLQTTLGYRLNDEADHLANLARETDTTHFVECMRFVDRFVFRNQNKHLVE
jgi:hypothetical protein